MELVNNAFKGLLALFFKKFWIQNCIWLSLPSLKSNGALVKGLRRLPFTEESRVRFPYVLQKPLKL